ncbi:HTH-type transcriptional regulator GltC [Rhodoplanes serenus]|uniref:HTH-type transcriptional regulator GltC n=1 Tax=Rhodoplanes serenus TaxID=200615 RepID=A0A447D0K4_9BRAD|nr:LysR substrate-binding domain-containing protein [Rhodoplanes serenus]VCU11076.1 HTH-type transcriptional regulator GltC [Rhodoplanes serenus]
MSTLDLLSLRLFASVVEHRNIAQASRANNIAPSAVSKRISDIEARVGVSLLYRLREGVEPTPAGQALYRHVKRLAKIIEDLEAELSEFSQGAKGRARLWANTSAVTQFLPEDLAVYTSQFPEVKIDLREEVSRTVAEAVQDGSADLGVFSDYIGETGLETRIYRRDTLMVIVPRGHPLEGRDSVTLADTLAYDHVGLQEGSSLQARLLSEVDRSQLALKLRVQVLSFDGVRRMVEAGLGVAVLPQGAVLPYATTGAFASLQLNEPWATRRLLLGFREYRSLPVVVRALVECLAPLDRRMLRDVAQAQELRAQEPRTQELGAQELGAQAPPAHDSHES